MRITTLIENSRKKGCLDLQAEHGLSFYLECPGHVFMSDVGESGCFADNATKLGLDPSLVEVVSISHHHYDHGGGLNRFFEENERGKVYVRRTSSVDFLVDEPRKPERYIGLAKELLDRYSKRIVYVNENLEIATGFHLLTEIPEVHPRPSGDKGLKMRLKGKKMQDTFQHEMVTVLEGEQGMVILTGCAHNGVLNMIEAAIKALPGIPIQAVIGGFHLLHEDARTVRKIGEGFLKMKVQTVYTGHCTGKKSFAVLDDVLGKRLHPLYTGLVISY